MKAEKIRVIVLTLSEDEATNLYNLLAEVHEQEGSFSADMVNTADSVFSQLDETL